MHVHGPAGQHYEVCMIEDEGSFCSSADYSYYHPSRPTCSLSGELLEAALFPEITPPCAFVCVSACWHPSYITPTVNKCLVRMCMWLVLCLIIKGSYFIQAVTRAAVNSFPDWPVIRTHPSLLETALLHLSSLGPAPLSALCPQKDILIHPEK